MGEGVADRVTVTVPFGARAPGDGIAGVPSAGAGVAAVPGAVGGGVTGNGAGDALGGTIMAGAGVAVDGAGDTAVAVMATSVAGSGVTLAAAVDGGAVGLAAGGSAGVGRDESGVSVAVAERTAPAADVAVGEAANVGSSAWSLDGSVGPAGVAVGVTADAGLGGFVSAAGVLGAAGLAMAAAWIDALPMSAVLCVPFTAAGTTRAPVPAGTGPPLDALGALPAMTTAVGSSPAGSGAATRAGGLLAVPGPLTRAVSSLTASRRRTISRLSCRARSSARACSAISGRTGGC